MSTVFLNGKFAARRVTGVQRVAMNLLLALDESLSVAGAANAATRWVLLCPPGAMPPTLRRIETCIVGSRSLPLHTWEQIVLPYAARSGLLLNLAGSAPLLAVRQVCLWHDAAVFDRPDAYTAAFSAWYRFAFRWLSGRAERLLTVSAFSRGRLARQLHLPESRIGIVPNGAEHLLSVPADGSVLRRLGLEGKSYFLAVGSRNPNKNLDLLISAWAGVSAKPMPSLVIVGGEDNRVFAGAARAGETPGSTVVDAGAIGDAELRALYENALALVFPSLYEGFGLPPLEAMACGCPVLCSDAASLPEVCGDAVLYFDPLSTEQISASMNRLLRDAELRASLRERGHAQARRFSWQLAAERLLAQIDVGAARVPV
jgi:glycosyltransferase involved in cell wall biosynthesis